MAKPEEVIERKFYAVGDSTFDKKKDAVAYSLCCARRESLVAVFTRQASVEELARFTFDRMIHMIADNGDEVIAALSKET